MANCAGIAPAASMRLTESFITNETGEACDGRHCAGISGLSSPGERPKHGREPGPPSLSLLSFRIWLRPVRNLGERTSPSTCGGTLCSTLRAKSRFLPAVGMTKLKIGGQHTEAGRDPFIVQLLRSHAGSCRYSRRARPGCLCCRRHRSRPDRPSGHVL